MAGIDMSLPMISGRGGAAEVAAAWSRVIRPKCSFGTLEWRKMQRFPYLRNGWAEDKWAGEGDVSTRVPGDPRGAEA